MVTLTTLPDQSSSVPVSVSLKVSQLVPSTQVVSLAQAPPVSGPCQTTFGPLGLIAPLGGLEASVERVNVKKQVAANSNRTNVSFSTTDRVWRRVFIFQTSTNEVGLRWGTFSGGEALGGTEDERYLLLVRFV